MAETKGQKHSLTTEILMDFKKSIEQTDQFATEVNELGTSFNNLSDSVEKIAKNTDRMNLAIGEKIAQAVADVKNGNTKINGKHIKDALEHAIAEKITGGKIEIEGNLHPLTVKMTSKKWKAMTEDLQEKMRVAIENSTIDTRGKVAPFVFNNYGWFQLQERFQKELHAAIEKRMEFAWGSSLKTMEDGTQQRVPKEMKFRIESEDLQKMMNAVTTKFMNHITNPKNITFGDMAPIHFDSAKMNMAIEKVKNAIGDIDKHLINVNFDELKKIPNLDKGMMNFKEAMSTTIAQITELDAELKGLRLNAQDAELASVLAKIKGLRTTVVDKVGVLIKGIGEDIKTVPLGTHEYANYKATLDNVGHIVNNYVQSEINAVVHGLAARLGIDPQTGASTKGAGETNKWVASMKGIQELLVASAEQAVKNLAQADLGVDFNLIVRHFQEWSAQMRAKMLTDSQESLSKLTAQLTASNQEVMASFARAITNVTAFRYDPSKVGKVEVELPVDQLRPRVITEIENVIKEMVGGFKAVPHGQAGSVGTVTLPEDTTTAINTALKGILSAQSEHLLAQLRNGADAKPSAEDVAQLDAVMAQESKELIHIIVNQAAKNARTLAEGISKNGFSSFTADEQARIKAEMEATLQKTVGDFTKAVDLAFGAFTMTAATAEAMHGKLSEELNRKIATSNITFLDAKEPLVLAGAIKGIQTKLQEAVLANIAAWKPEHVAFHLDTDAPTTAIKNAMHTMLNTASTKVVEGAGGIADGTNAIFLDPKKLHKDVRRALATAEKFDKVKDWEKAFKEGVSLEKATGQVMTEGVRQVMNMFHNAVAKNTTSAISAYGEALGQVDITPDLTSVHVMVRRVGEMMDSVQFRMVEALTKNLDAFYKGAIDGIKNLPPVTQSIGYRPPAGGVVQSAPQPFPFGGSKDFTLVGNPYTRSNSLVDPRYPSVDRMPKGYNEFDMMNKFEREAQIKVLNTKNRFENSDLTKEQRGQLHNFLDNDYMVRVQEAISRFQQGHRVGDLSPYQTMREAITDATLSLRYTVEQFRKMNFGSTTQANASELKGKLREYGYDTQLNVEGMKTKFLNKLNPEQFAMLENYLNEVQAKVNRLASSDIINEKDITNARMEMRELSRELDVISKGFDRMAKVSGMEAQIDKLSEKMNRLLMNSQLPINKVAHLGDLINGSYSDPTKFDQAKDYYADLVRENRALQAAQRKAEAQAQSEAEKEELRQATLANAKMSMQERLRIFEDNQRVGADRLLGKYRNKLSNEDYATLQSQVSSHLGRVGELVRSPITDFSSLSVIKEDMATILNRVKEISTAWDNVLKDNKVSREMDVLNTKLEKIRQIGKVDQAEIQAVQNAINAVATDATRMNPAKDALNRLLEMQAKRIADEKAANRLAGVDLNRRMYEANQVVAMDKMKDKYLRKLNSDDYGKLVSDLDAHRSRIGAVTSSPITNDADAANVQAMMKTLNIQLAEIARRYNALASDESFQTKLVKLRRDLEALKLDNLVDVSSIAKLGEMIDKAITEGDIVQARLYRDELMKTNKELKQLEAAQRKRGEKIAESHILKGDKAVFTEQLNAVLKTVDALKGYEITQMNVNNATNTWTVKMKDAEGNLRTLTGSIDKATGELYKHSEALQVVTHNALRASSSIGSSFGRSGDILGNYMSNPVQDKRANAGLMGGFGTSVLNTMRYITAGAVMGYPTMLLNESFQSAKEMDYQMAKATQNFEVKYLEPTGANYEYKNGDGDTVTAPKMLPNMSRLGEVLVEGAMGSLEQKYGGKLTESQKKDEVSNATAQVTEYMKTGAVKDLQMIALLNGIDQEDVGLAYHIASRRYDNPYEATAFAKEVAKVRSIEDVDVEKAATGFEAISSQWGINGYALQKVTNMMIMAANISQAKIEDLIATQQKAGSMFRNAMGDQNKESALAHSIAYSSMFVQATARSGAESGTFWKAILDKPYTKKGREELASMAALNPKEWGGLNPFNKDGSQKDFSEIFANILETSATVNDESRVKMWQKLFPQWHMGSAAAVSAFTSDLQHTMEKVMHVTGDKASDKDGDGKLSVKESIDAYVSQIQGADENTSMYIRAGMMDTWKFKQQQVKTAWQISTYEAWENLKGEFSNLATYLTAFLRIVGDNASGIADTMGLIARIMAGVGVRIAWNKFSNWVDDKEKQKHSKKIEKYGTALNENARMENLRRIGIQEEIAQHQQRANARNSYRAEVNTKIVEKEGEVLGLQAKRDEHQKLYEKAIENGDTTAASFHATERDQADNKAKAKSKEVEQLRKELGSLDAQDAKTKRSLEVLNAELDENGRSMVQLQNRAKALTLAMDDMGIDSTQLRNNLQFLNREFQSGTLDASRYDAEISKLGREAGMSDDDISKLKREVDQLNNSFKQGALNATQYVNKMKELERAHLTGSLDVPGGGVANAGSAGHSGMGLAEYAMMGLLAKDLLPGGGKRGMFTKVKDVFQTKSLKSLFNKNAPARDNAGNILRDRDGKAIRQAEIDTERATRAGRVAGAADDVADAARGGKSIMGKVAGVGKKLTKGLKFLKPLKAVPYLGAALAGADLLMAAIDPLTAMGMSDSEKKSVRAENKQELAKDFEDLQKSSGIGKIWKGANLLWDGAFSGVGAMLGGNNASWKNYWDGFSTVISGKDAKTTLAEKYNYEQEALDAKVEAQMELNEKLKEQDKYHPFDTNKDGLLDPATDGTNQTMDYESLEELMSKVSTNLSNKMGHNESTYQITRSRLLISGVREDSKQMRDLMEQYLRENLKFFSEAIKKLQETYDLMADGEDKDKVGAELDNLKQQKAQTEYDLSNVKNSAIDELQRQMTDALDLTQMDYDKRMYQLLAANGGNEEDPQYKALEKERASTVNSKLSEFQVKWDNLLKTGGFNPNSDEYMTIFKQLQSIGVEQAKNLAEINKNTKQSQATFNLPNGLKVMDYFDYMTQANTHKSVMVGAGNVTVHVNIDNMTGDTKDVEKMTAALEQTLKKNNTGLVNQFASDVGANMGSNYKPR